jgi:hypothetical protein
MKTLIGCIVFMLSFKSGFCQVDSIKPLVQKEPLFRLVDSMSNDIVKTNKDFILSICWFGISKQSAAVIWKDKENYCGLYLKEKEDGIFKKSNIAKRKIKSIMSNRLLSDNCNLCELLNGEKKVDVDHDYMLYIRRKGNVKCNEMYFTSASTIYYSGSNSCINDLQLLSF